MVNVQVKDIKIQYQRATEPALNIPDLNLSAGDVLAVVGVSGSGKSTLLRTVAGFVRPTGAHGSASKWLNWLVSPRDRVPLEGKVFFDGRDVSDLSPRLRRIAFATQALNLYPNMTVRENVAFPLRMARQEAGAITESVERMAKKLHIEHLLERMPSEISGGEQQRVALGRALVQDVRVYLFDEPLSSIDAPLRAVFRKDLRSWLRKPRRTTFYVTHDMDEAFTIADRIAVLHQGHLLQVGTPSELYKSPNSLTVAKLVWGGRAVILSGEINRLNGHPRFNIGPTFFDMQLPKALSSESKIWLAAPREAFNLTSDDVNSNALSGRVTDIRFAAASYVVDIEGANFFIEVAVNGHNLPRVGREVKVAVNTDYLRAFPRKEDEKEGLINFI